MLVQAPTTRGVKRVQIVHTQYHFYRGRAFYRQPSCTEILLPLGNLMRVMPSSALCPYKTASVSA